MSKRPDRQSPDYLLAPEGFPSLNETLYSAAPQDYFERRLVNLALVGSKRAELDELLKDGFGFGALHIGPGKEQTTEEERAKTSSHFVTAEAEVLGHHVGETLLRLYLAHRWGKAAAAPGCPWLEMSRLRSFAEFKRQVAKRFKETSRDDSDALAEVARVFYVTDRPDDFGPNLDVERWSKSLSAIEGYLRAFAVEFLDRAPLYNAAKHGFALMPTEMSLKVAIIEQPMGPVVRYLEANPDPKDDGRTYWSEVTHWVKPDLRMLLIWIGCVLIELLWRAATYRYVRSGREGGFKLTLFEGPAYSEAIKNSHESLSGIELTDMSMRLHYYREDGEASDQDGTLPTQSE